MLGLHRRFRSPAWLRRHSVRGAAEATSGSTAPSCDSTAARTAARARCSSTRWVAGRDLQSLADVVGVPAADVAQRDHDALSLRQRLDRAHDHVAELAGEQTLLVSATA